MSWRFFFVCLLSFFYFLPHSSYFLTFRSYQNLTWSPSHYLLVALNSSPHEKTLDCHCHLPCILVIPPPPFLEAWLLISTPLWTHSMSKQLTCFMNEQPHKLSQFFSYHTQPLIPKFSWSVQHTQTTRKVNKINLVRKP